MSGTSLVKTPHLHCRGPGFRPWSENYDPTCRVAQPKKKKNQMASVLCSEPSHDHPSLRVEIPTRAISSLSEPTSCHSLTSGHSPVPLCRRPPRGLPSWPLSLLQFCSTVTLFKTATTSSFSPSFLILSSSYPHSYSLITFLQSSHHHLILIHLFCLYAYC